MRSLPCEKYHWFYLSYACVSDSSLHLLFYGLTVTPTNLLLRRLRYFLFFLCYFMINYYRFDEVSSHIRKVTCKRLGVETCCLSFFDLFMLFSVLSSMFLLEVVLFISLHSCLLRCFACSNHNFLLFKIWTSDVMVCGVSPHTWSSSLRKPSFLRLVGGRYLDLLFIPGHNRKVTWSGPKLVAFLFFFFLFLYFSSFFIRFLLLFSFSTSSTLC